MAAPSPSEAQTRAKELLLNGVRPVPLETQSAEANSGLDVGNNHDGEAEELRRRRAWNARICMWISYWATVTMVMAAGPFLDMYIYLASGSNSMVGGIESMRGLAQLLAAPVLGILADRVDRYQAARLHALLRVIPVALLAYVVGSGRYRLLYGALPLFAVSNHFRLTLQGALLADNLEEGAPRTKGLAKNFSLQYLGQATGPMLQLLALVAVNGHGEWKLPELRFAILSGCAVFCVAEPAALLFRPVAPVCNTARRGPAAGAQNSSGDSSGAGLEESGWRHDKVLRGWSCCASGRGVNRMWAIPVLVEATFFVVVFGSGMTVKYFPLYFATNFKLSPLQLCVLTALEPLGVAFLVRATPWTSKRLGRPGAALFFMLLAPVLLVAMTEAPWIWAAAPLFVLRTSAARAYIPIFQSIVATCVPPEHRGKFAAIGAFRMSFFSASAFVGGWMADTFHSYRPAFLVTAAWQIVPGAAMFFPILFWLPRSADTE